MPAKSFSVALPEGLVILLIIPPVSEEELLNIK